MKLTNEMKVERIVKGVVANTALFQSLVKGDRAPLMPSSYRKVSKYLASKGVKKEDIFNLMNRIANKLAVLITTSNTTTSNTTTETTTGTLVSRKEFLALLANDKARKEVYRKLANGENPFVTNKEVTEVAKEVVVQEVQQELSIDNL